MKNKLSFKSVIIAFSIILICESTAFFWKTMCSPLLTMTVIRGSEIYLLLSYLFFLPGGLQACGCSIKQLSGGIKAGFFWSAVFGGIAFLTGVLIHFGGHDPVQLIRINIPGTPVKLIHFFIAAGVVSPVAEELFFRGIIYSFCRKYGAGTALVFSSILFAAAHLNHNTIPFFQLVGGLVFGLSFEHSGSIATPLIIHILGNIAIFSISLIQY